MNELRRMQYLDALGIDQYVPRRVLPHSAPLKSCELPVSVSQEVLSDPLALDVENTADRERSLPKAAAAVHRLVDVETIRKGSEVSTRVLDELTQKEKPSTKQTQVVEEIAQAEETVSASPQFSLSLWQLPEGVMVIDSHEPRSALPTDKLLANILLASGMLTLNLPKAGLLTWPATAAPQADKSWRAASEYVESYIDAARQKHSIKTVILMGETALVSVAGEAALKELQLGQGFTLELLAVPALYLPSLVTILRHPEYKGLVWRGLSRITSTAL